MAKDVLQGEHLRKVDIRGLSKEEWLKIRRATVGGSEVGALLGMNQYQSAYSLYCDKLELVPPFEGNLATEVGTFMEEFVAQKFSTVSGLKVQKTNFIWYNSEYEGLHASPDRFVLAPKKRKAVAGLEIKTTSAFNASKFKGSDFPVQYYAQCVQYMAVTELPVWYLAVLVGNHEFHIYQLTRDKETPQPDWCEAQVYVEDDEIRVLYERAREFLEHVATHNPPDVDGSSATSEVIRETAPASTDREIDLSRYEPDIDRYFALKEQADLVNEQADAILNALKLEMGDAGTAMAMGYKITYRSQVSNRIDSRRLKAELPDIYSRYTQPSVSRPMRIVKITK